MKFLFFLLIIPLTVVGCSPHSGNSSEDRVAAVVNGVEITNLEVNTIYERTAVRGISKDVARDQKRNVLAGLVHAELLAQQAVKQNLDKSPEFTLLLHESRRQVLAGMLQQSLASAAKPLEIEAVRDIVSQNPLLFDERKLLVYEQVLMPVVNEPFLLSLNMRVSKGATLDQLVEEIKDKRMQFQRVKQIQSTDQLAPAIVKVLTSSKPDVPVVARVQDKFAMILVLRNVVPIPLTGEAAEQAARNIASAQMRNIAIQKKMKDVLDRAKITYFGEYAKDTSGKKGVALPLPDKARAEKMNSYSVILAVSITVAYAFAMLLFSASMRLLLGRVWLPRLWLTPRVQPVEPEVDLWLPEYRASFYVKFFLFCCAVVSVFMLGRQLLPVWTMLEVWMVIASIVTGVLLGIGLSHLYARSPLRNWTKGLRRWVPVVFFTLSLAAAVVVTLRFVSV